MAGHSDQQKFWTPVSGGLDLVLPNNARKGLIWFWPDFRGGNKCPQTACSGKKNFSLWKIMAFSTFPRMTSTREQCQKCDFHVSAATDNFLSLLAFFLICINKGTSQSFKKYEHLKHFQALQVVIIIRSKWPCFLEMLFHVSLFWFLTGDLYMQPCWTEIIEVDTMTTPKWIFSLLDLFHQLCTWMFHLVCPETLKPEGRGLEVIQPMVAENRINQGKRRRTETSGKPSFLTGPLLFRLTQRSP